MGHAVAAVGGNGGGTGDKAFHLDIQQQVITTGNGFKLNVIRMMQHEGAVHVDTTQELKKIDAAVASDNNDNKVIAADNNDTEEKAAVDDDKPLTSDDPDSANDNNKVTADDSASNEAQPEKVFVQNTDAGDTVTVVEKMHKVKVDVDDETMERIQKKKESPPESIFNKLKPSNERYTIVRGPRDEF